MYVNGVVKHPRNFNYSSKHVSQMKYTDAELARVSASPLMPCHANSVRVTVASVWQVS